MQVVRVKKSRPPSTPLPETKPLPESDSRPPDTRDIFFLLTQNPGLLRELNYFPQSESEENTYKRISRAAYSHFNASLQTSITLNFEDSIKQIQGGRPRRAVVQLTEQDSKPGVHFLKKIQRLLISVKNVSRPNFISELPQYEYINHLKFWCCAFGDYKVEDITRALPNLNKFEVHYCYSDENISGSESARLQVEMVDLTHQKLKSISICHCFCGSNRPRIFPLFVTDGIESNPHLNFNFDGFSARFPSLTHLNLSHNNFNEEEISTIQSGLKSLPLLNSLDMTHCNTTIKQTASVLGFSTSQSVNMTSLEHLRIDMEKKKYRTVSDIQESAEQDTIATYFSSGLEKMTNLKSLALPLVVLPYENFVDSLMSLQKLQSLEKIDISCRDEYHTKSYNSILHDPDETLMNAVGKCTKLTELVINASNVHGWMFNVNPQYNATLFQNLRCIYLDYCFRKQLGVVTDYDYGLGNIIKKLSHYKQLEKISMSGNAMKIQNLEKISQYFSCYNLPNLTELDLSHNIFGWDLTDNTVVDFSKFTKLIDLNIQGSITTQDLDNLEIILPPNLNKLNISNIKATNYYGNYSSILNEIQKTQTLSVLNFENNGIGEIKFEPQHDDIRRVVFQWFESFRARSSDYNPRMVKVFSMTIRSLKNISHLNLAKNLLTTANLRMLSIGIQECKYLKNLNLAQNLIGQDKSWGFHLHPISAIIISCKSLVVLNLEDNYIEFNDIRNMNANLNQTHPLLYELNLSGNYITKTKNFVGEIYSPSYNESVRILFSFLSVFKELEVLKMENTGLLEQTFKPLINHLKNMTPLLHTLRLKLNRERSGAASQIRDHFANEYGYSWDQLVMSGDIEL